MLLPVYLYTLPAALSVYLLRFAPVSPVIDWFSAPANKYTHVKKLTK